MIVPCLDHAELALRKKGTWRPVKSFGTLISCLLSPDHQSRAPCGQHEKERQADRERGGTLVSGITDVLPRFIITGCYSLLPNRAMYPYLNILTLDKRGYFGWLLWLVSLDTAKEKETLNNKERKNKTKHEELLQIRSQTCALHPTRHIKERLWI